MIQQVDCQLLAANEYSLLMWKIVMCSPDTMYKREALAIIAVLSSVKQRYVVERQHLVNMLTKEPPARRDTIDLPASDVRSLPTETDWEAMFHDPGPTTTALSQAKV